MRRGEAQLAGSPAPRGADAAGVDVAGVNVAGHRLVLREDGVLRDGCPVAVSPAPLTVLRALASRPGRVVSRRELLGALPSGTAGSEHAVEVAVARLRSALGSAVVETVVKRGYRLPLS